jgi:DNA helicase-2/ATP-dependent DNA helicase PcrA
MDHGRNMKEIRIFGPPGTGKTTFLARQIDLAVEKYGSENVMVASFTRSAATELVSRDLPVPRNAVGTLHSLCYRSLESPEIAETHINEFNKQYPRFQLSPEAGGKMDEMIVEMQWNTEADKLLNQLNLNRARRIDRRMWQKSVIAFESAWTEWKFLSGYVDFTDMISLVLETGSPPPGEPKVGFYDEVQDFNRMELDLIRHWAKSQEIILLAGDDDQAIYQFTGATPDAFLTPDIPQDQKRILSQSWRVPRKIQKMANQWIKQVKQREPKEYKPRDDDGSVTLLGPNITYKNPERLLDAMHKKIQNNETVMVLASCSYMLGPLKQLLRKEGIPFHNPYRKTRGDWNPLGTFEQNRKIVPIRDRFLAFIDDSYVIDGFPVWSMKNFATWIDVIKADGVIKHGMKKHIENVIDESGDNFPEHPMAFYRRVFHEQALVDAMSHSPTWFYSHTLATKRNVLDYVVEVHAKRGIQALVEPPKLCIGTIHSVKGGESDTVVLFPDLSVAGMREYENTNTRDSVVRTFYVAITRTRKDLVVCRPVGGMSIKL